jgi:phosphoribosylamine--glycine ligase
MKVLIIGNGGREHALAWKCAQSPRVSTVLVAPGNAGTAREPRCRNAPVSAEDVPGLLALARTEGVHLTLVGPEAPLVRGVVDAFRAAGLAIFGPTQAAAQLEGSKAFAKDFMARHHIPTAAYGVFTEVSAAETFIRSLPAPPVVKADGLAAGKGVIVAASHDAACRAARDMLAGNAFGTAGHRVVVEEFLPGEEASFICMVDGVHVLPMASSQDHKRLGDGDAGPNTGGMGAYSPAPVVTPEVHARVMREVIEPTVRGMAADGLPYTGFLYAGLMIAPEGGVKVLEYNCRFGDPETQPIMMRLQSDLTALAEAAIAGRLHQTTARWDDRAALGVVLAAAGYPDNPRKGDAIHWTGAPDAHSAKLFHAGTADHDGGIVTSGGRVLCATGLGADIAAAQRTAYGAVQTVHFDGMQYRRDIGWRALR